MLNFTLIGAATKPGLYLDWLKEFCFICLFFTLFGPYKSSSQHTVHTEGWGTHSH